MKRRMVDLETARKRLSALPNLEQVLASNNWLERQLTKPVQDWSQITGWLCSWEEGKPEDEVFVSWIKDVDTALGFLQERVSQKNWAVICRKVRAHSDRQETLGTLSELAVCMFLAANNISFDFEVNLQPESRTNVDFQVDPGCGRPVNIEVQWLSPSDRSERGARLAAIYGGAYPFQYKQEGFRIKQKVYDKIQKLTSEDTTLVALNYTLCPEMIEVGKEVMSETFTGLDFEGQPGCYADSPIDTAVRQFVDGVMWFTQAPGIHLQPITRGVLVNSSSTKVEDIGLSEFIRLWETSHR